MTAATSTGLTALKHEVVAAVDRNAAELVGLSHALHGRPELAFAEHFATSSLADALARKTFRVIRGAYGLPTAFRATAGRRGRLVVICCEYDALPGIGHACGHNVVAAAGVGAGIALAPLADRLGRQIVVLGTPAEEGGGGKIILARRGAFALAAAVMLAHPGDDDVVTPVLRAAASFEVRFAGHSAHSAMAPESGRNALDAAILSYQAMGAARSTLAVGDHLSAVLTEGGIAANVIPADSTLKVMIRSRHSSRLPMLLAMVHRCCAAGADAVRCRYRLRANGPIYRELRHHQPLAEAFTCNARKLGRTMRPGGPEQVARAGSSDLGNVSRLAPTIHPKLAIAGPGTAQHTREFAIAAISPRADLAVLDGAKAMAMTALDVWSRPITHDRRGTC